MPNLSRKLPNGWFWEMKRVKPENDVVHKERLDALLIKKGFTTSHSMAKAFILSGSVWVDGKKVDKVGTEVRTDAKIEVKGQDIPYVSRGGLKLEKALREFNIDVRGKVALDVGAGTGGFTDCLLKHGTKLVYAVDVGYGQLDFKLRQDPRVVPIERQNIRYLKRDDISGMVDLATIDVSFISLKKVIPSVKNIIKENGEIVGLIKPQFEVGKGEVEKGGVVTNTQKHHKVIQEITHFCENLGFRVIGVTESPILGPKGNKEFLMYLRNMLS